MAQNETLIQVPNSLDEPIQLRKFLLQLIEKLDIILGYRGQDPYLKNTDLGTTENTITSLLSSVDAVEADIVEIQKDLDDFSSELDSLSSEFDAAQIAAYTTTALGVAYNDFNYTGYFTLKGFGQFTALGSAITNPPAGAGLVGATSYTVLIFSYINSGGGCVNEVYITSATTKTFHKRAGSTSALVLSLGWF